MPPISQTERSSIGSVPRIGYAVLGAASAMFFMLMLIVASATITEDKDDVLDDAYITYIYGKNLAEGHGIRYNPSDEAVTEGSSSILQVLMVAAGHQLDIDPLTLSRFLALASFVAFALVMAALAQRRARVEPVAAFICAIIASFVLFALPETNNHLTSGLETMMFLSLYGALTVWAYSFATASQKSGFLLDLFGFVVAALLILARPEGFVLTCALLIVALIARLNEKPELGIRTALGEIAPVALSITAFLALYFSWKISYFGDIFPTSYWVKSNNNLYGGSGELMPGLRHVVGLLALRWLPLAALVVALLWTGAGRRTAQTGALLLLPSLMVALLYLTAIHEVTGGLRYGYPLLAPLFVLACLGLAFHVRQRQDVLPAAGLAGLLIAAPLVVSPSSETLRLLESPKYAVTGWVNHAPYLTGLSEVANDLEATGLGDQATFLTSAAGIITYQSGMNTIDWLGLNTDQLSGKLDLSPAEARAFVTAQRPDVALSIFPAAHQDSTSFADDPGFNSNSVRSTMNGRGVKLFKHWDQTLASEMIYSHMEWLRDQTELVMCYPLPRNWAIFLHVRSDSPHYEKLSKTLQNSEAETCDPDRIKRMYNLEKYETVHHTQLSAG